MESRENLRKTFFRYKEVIGDGSRQNGWLTPDGGFYACEPNEHDKCAAYVVEKNTSLRSLGEGVLPRSFLMGEGYALISSGRVVLPENDLSFEQLRLIEESGVLMLEEPIVKLVDYEEYIRAVREKTKLDDYKAIAEEIDWYGGSCDPSLGKVRVGEVVERFLGNPNKEMIITDNEKVAEYLLEMFSGGYEKELVLPAGEHDLDDYVYRVLPGGKLVLRMLKHSHDGRSEGMYGSVNWHFRVINLKVMLRNIRKIVGTKGYKVMGDKEVYEGWMDKEMAKEMAEVKSGIDVDDLEPGVAEYVARFLELKRGRFLPVPSERMEVVYKSLSKGFSVDEVVIKKKDEDDKLAFRSSISGGWVLAASWGKESGVRLLFKDEARRFVREGVRRSWREVVITGNEKLMCLLAVRYWSYLGR